MSDDGLSFGSDNEATSGFETTATSFFPQAEKESLKPPRKATLNPRPSLAGSRRASLKEGLQQRRSSSKAQQRGSIFGTGFEEACEIPVKPRRVLGQLVDFLIRIKPTTEDMHPHEHVSRILGVSPVQQGTQQWRGYLKAIEAVNHEMLYSAIMEDIIVFQKAVGNPGWFSEKQLFRKRALECYRFKQQALCIRAEVKDWLFHHTVRAFRSKMPTHENQRSRHERHQEFWAQFHEVPRKLEVHKASPDSPRFNQHQRSHLRSVVPRGKGLDVKNKRDQDCQWKDRPARSRCSAGSWDWSRGNQKKKDRLSQTTSSLWKFDEMPDFASDSGDAPPRTAPSKKNHMWWQAHQPVPDAVTPHVNRSRGFSVSANVAMGKSSSLPSLSEKRSPRQQRLATQSRSRSSLEIDESENITALPPISSAYVVPWQGKSPTPILRGEESPTKRYLTAAQCEGSLPRPIPFITGHSLKFTAGDQSLCDKDLIAVVDMMPNMEIEEVDLEGNLLLSETALMRLMEVLQVSPVAESLLHLSLKRCVSAGQKVLDMVISMMGDLTEGCFNLQVLNLSGISIGSRRHLPLAKAIGNHPSLTKVMLGDTGLGESPHPDLCIESITGSRSITSLDLGWNCFGEEVFALIGERLTEIGKMEELVLANCSAAGAHGHATPLVFFIEYLSRCFSLKVLDISLNRIDFRAALVVEDALELCPTLRNLRLSHNPLGFLGLRSILRLISRENSGLQHFTFNDCSTGKASDQDELYQVFSCTNPGGRYKLDLSRPYHRSILRMLYKTSERYALPHDVAFSHISATPKYEHPSKSNGIWQVPSSGHLSVTFSVDKAVEDAIGHVNEWDFGNIIDRYLCMTRLQPSFHKVVPLLAMWKSIDGRMQEQRTFLNAMSKDFFLQYPHIEQMTSNRGMTVEILAQLMHCVRGGQVTRFLSMLLVPSLGEYLGVMKKQRALLTFNVDNPNGHYKLDLESVSEYAVAERLLLLDRWETRIAQWLGRLDTSQRGNHSQIRNERFQQRPILATSCQEWNMPEESEFEFDYSSGKRPPADALPIDEVTFANVLVTLQMSECEPWVQLHALQMVADKMFLKAVQMRALLGIYATKEMRADLFVLFFLRVVDFYNEKLYRVRFEHQHELDSLASRLGIVTLFPFIQPEQTRFVFDFSFYEERLAANLLLCLSGKESPSNVRDPKLIREDGSEDPMPAGIPPTWQTLSKLPTGGKLHVSYVCAPEDRNYKIRRSYYESYGYRPGVPEEDVLWWAALNESPEDVLEYLAFLVQKFPNPNDAFSVIDGIDGNGVLSLREFEDAYREMGCEKFKCPPEPKKSEEEAKRLELARVQAVFRYLDPSGEGQVSKGEWNILELLWSEIKLSITEFIQFCERTFGDDLKDAWEFLDDDGGGEISMKEWIKACEECGFFGPVIPIFRFLDADDQGTVSLDEFELLEKFQAEPENRHNARVQKLREKEAASYTPSPSRPESRQRTASSLSSRPQSRQEHL